MKPMLLSLLLPLLAACTSPSHDGMQTSMKYEMPVDGMITFSN